MATNGPKQSSLSGEAEVEAIAKIYAQAGDKIQSTLLGLAATGKEPTPAQRRRARREAEALMTRAEAAAEKLLTRGATIAAAEGMAAVPSAKRVINAEARRVVAANMRMSAERVAAERVARAMPYLRAQTVAIGSAADDALRRIGLRAVLTSLEQERTTRETARDVATRLQNVPSIDDINGRRLLQVGGRRYDPEAYSRLVARTTTREARTAGFINRCRDEGIDLVTVTDHAGGCEEVCAQYEGETFSLSGTTPGYPVLDEMPPFHPNCRHVLTPAGNDALGTATDTGTE